MAIYGGADGSTAPIERLKKAVLYEDEVGFGVWKVQMGP